MQLIYKQHTFRIQSNVNILQFAGLANMMIDRVYFLNEIIGSALSCGWSHKMSHLFCNMTINNHVQVNY